MIHPLVEYTAVITDIAETIHRDSRETQPAPFRPAAGRWSFNGRRAPCREPVSADRQCSYRRGVRRRRFTFRKSYVYDGNGHFVSDAAVFAVIETSSPVATFKIQHFEPSDVELVITEADAEKRLILEINGEPAAQVYAESLGLTVDELTPTVFSRNPLVLFRRRALRSIQKMNADLSYLLLRH